MSHPPFFNVDMKAKRRKQKKQKNQLSLRDIRPLTKNQENAFSEFDNGKNLILHGYAGTGKTFLALYLLLEDMFAFDETKEKTIIARSPVPTRQIGYLKGSLAQKIEPFEAPYRAHCSNLFGRGDAYDILKKTSSKNVEFMSTCHLRGITLENTNLLVDEPQNMTEHELDSLITRVGENCRIVFAGDFRQTDLKENGLYTTIQILKKLNEFAIIEFGIEDIVRSGFVKNYIIARENYHASKRGIPA